MTFFVRSRPTSTRFIGGKILVEPQNAVYQDALCISENGAIDESLHSSVAVCDLEGDFLVPGFIDLHTDALEGRLEPRASVHWPSEAAMLSHDRELISSGVTTAYNAVCIGTTSRKPDRMKKVRPFSEAVLHGRASGTLLADHKLHLRCEVTDPEMPNYLQAILKELTPDAMSIMDHAPGHRQCSDIEKFASWIMEHTHNSREQTFKELEEIADQSRDHGDARSALVAKLAKDHGISLATHDDETIEHVNVSAQLGADYAEFPVTRAAAQHAKVKNQSVVMGAPNVVRGGSSGGNVNAKDLIQDGLVDGLVSDFVPSSQFFAVRKLVADKACDLAEAISLVTDGPAAMAKLRDRGTLKHKMRADLVRLRETNAGLMIKAVWVGGNLVFQA